MSLITRCPACGTMFKVVPDQLRISEGWVRCGHCSEVFDAASQLQGDTAGRETVPGDLPVSMPPPPRNTNVRDPGDSGVSSMHSESFQSSVITEVGSSLPPDAPDSLMLREEARRLIEGPLDRPFVLQRQDDPPPTEERPLTLPPEPQTEADADLHDLSFVRDARRNAFWSSTTMRLAQWAFVLVFGAILALQFAMHDRDKLAAMQPNLKPWLQFMCDRLNCRIAPPQQIEAIAIDSSSFNKLRADTYRLSVTLKNQGVIEVEMPSIELTLTDAQDQAIVRRVVTPAEMTPRRAVLAPGGDWSGNVALAVAPNGPAARVAGYRVLAFYP
ncbi:MAG: zinc-ribbon domain-containing protein [Ramlibacter sp.]|nr:zinc-ribbon domain-containing protein [Ramlibacter sp.]